jgi:hypothetical protein
LRLEDWWWLAFKNIDYLSNAANTLMTSNDYSEVILIPARAIVREQVLESLQDDNIDVTNLTKSLPQILKPLRDYDRKEVLNALVTKEAVKPLERSWVHDYDTRDELRK